MGGEEIKQAARRELARRELERRAEIQTANASIGSTPEGIANEEPMLNPENFKTADIYNTPQGMSPLQSAMQTAKRGIGSAMGAVIPGGEITARRPELAARTAGAVLAPVGSLVGLGGEALGRELAPEGKEDIGQLVGGLAGGIAGEAGVMGLRKLSSGIAGKIINSMINPKANAFKYGKNPGKTVSDLGVKGNSLEDLLQNVTNTIKTKMDDLATMVKSPKNIGKTIDYTDAFSVIDDTIDDLSKAEGTNEAIINKVTTLKDDLIKLAKNITKLSPEDAIEVKRVTGGQAKWTGTDAPPEYQALIHKVYNSMRKSMEKVIPESAKVNKDISGLIGAQRAIPDAIARGSKQMLPLNFKDIFTAAGGTIASGGNPAVGLGLMGAQKALSTPAVGTRVASGLAKFAGNRGRLLNALLPK